MCVCVYIIRYDNCLLKYSNLDFFGKIDYQNRFYMWNLRNVSDPIWFNQKTKNLLSQLSEEAYVAPKMYATGELELGESEKLYGLVQCTRDLSTVRLQEVSRWRHKRASKLLRWQRRRESCWWEL